MFDVAIVGASGYGGGELIRWLSHHPEARLKKAVSETYAGQPVTSAFPAYRSNKPYPVFTADSQAAASADVVFLAGEAGLAMCMAEELLVAGCKVVDLSADFRFTDPGQYQAWYGQPHGSPTLNEMAVYGLPELHKGQIAESKLVGNPGCYTTASILAVAPLVAEGLIHLDSIVIDGKSGISGAGRSKNDLAYKFAEANESVAAYKVGGTHRHTGEIEQELSALAGERVTVSFTPHLVPMTRGILVSAYASLKATAPNLKDLYKEFYSQEPFVAITDNPPATKHTLGSNMVHLCPVVDPRTNRVSVFSALDNLGKGMAGQAIQNMNLMLGLPETTGLEVLPLWP